MDRRTIEGLTSGQHSLFATWQTKVTESALRRAAQTRWLKPYRWRSVYAIAGAAPTIYRPLMGACLAGGPSVYAAGLGAAWLYGAPDVAPALEVINFGGRTRLDGVAARRTDLAPEGLVEVRFGVPVVSAALCVVQLAGPWPLLVPKVANNLVARGLTDFGEILECLDTIAPRGPGSRDLRALCLRELEVAGHDDSSAARDLGRAILRAGLGPFDAQYKVEDDEGVMFIDFAWPGPKVGIEYQGRADHAETRKAIDDDNRRRARLAALGWRILDATSGIPVPDILRWTAAALANGQKPSV